jgi:hypothetical protein
MDHIGSPSPDLVKNSPKEQKIKSNLVWRRTNLIVFAKWDAHCTPDTQACQVLPIAIGTGPYPVPELLEDSDFFQNAHRTPIV